MLEEVLRHLNNWFVVTAQASDFTIVDGSLSLAFLREGQWYRIEGSLFNDGLHKFQDDVLVDEEFTGTVYGLAIPNAVLDLVAEIDDWQQTNGDVVSSPYTSESYGGYSYTKSANEASGAALTWQGVFASRLNAWRKIF